MQQRTLILGLITSILLVIFALQNASMVHVKLWFWEFESSLALVLLIALAVGALLGIIFSIPSRKAKRKKTEEKDEAQNDNETFKEE